MKKKGTKKSIKVTVTAAIMAILAFLFGKCGFGFGFGNGNGNSDENSKVQSIEENVEPVSQEVPQNLLTDSENKGDISSKNNIEQINIVGNDYFYNNQRISLEEIAAVLANKTGVMVEIKDDNASLDDFEALVNRLKADGVSYRIVESEN